MIPHDIEEKILRLYFVEQWAIGTIATQCGVHHTTVRRVLHDRGVPPPARIAVHTRSFDRGAQVELAAHLDALAAWKREAREGRGLDRLHHCAPSSTRLLAAAAKRWHNLGSAVAGLLRLVDTWGAVAVEQAVAEAVAADAMHVAAVRQLLEQRAEAAGQPPPLPIPLPDKVRDLQVTPHALASYDLEVDHVF